MIKLQVEMNLMMNIIDTVFDFQELYKLMMDICILSHETIIYDSKIPINLNRHIKQIKDITFLNNFYLQFTEIILECKEALKLHVSSLKKDKHKLRQNFNKIFILHL